MKRSHVLSLAAALSLLGTHASAQDAGPKDAGPGPVDASAPLPAGHPMVTDEEDVDEDPHAHAHGQGQAPNGLPQVPRDGVLEDPTLPTGVIQVHLADVDSKPIPHQEVTLGILYNSVAKGESRKRVTALTDDIGTATFKNLDVGSGVAYRAMVLKEGATFAVTPFVLTQKMGSQVLLHSYPIEKDVEKTLIAVRALTYVEVKDDRVQVQQAFQIFNGGKSAWVPDDYVIALPPEFTAFTTQQGMTDVGVDAIPKKGVKLHGTFAPGQHSVEFRWQFPYSGDSEVGFEVGMAPHIAEAQVITPASRQMALEVADFPPPQTTTDQNGTRVLYTSKQGGRNTPIPTVKVEIKNLPTEGPAKIIATLIAALGIVAGGLASAKKPTSRNLPAEREKILASLDALEAAKASGDVGPKTYERNRRNLLDDLARTYAAETPKASTKKKPAVAT